MHFNMSLPESINYMRTMIMVMMITDFKNPDQVQHELPLKKCTRSEKKPGTKTVQLTFLPYQKIIYNRRVLNFLKKNNKY